MRIRRNINEGTLTFQIAPMVDVVFILLLFFMVSAGSIRIEQELNIQLPGRVAQEEPLAIPDEQIIQIEEDGQVVLNDEPLDARDSHDLPTLVNLLTRYKESCDANQQDALVTISCAENSKYQRAVDVLDACATAKIKSVTFTTEGLGELE